MTAEGNWKAVRGVFKPRSRAEVTAAGVSERVTNASFPETAYEDLPPIEEENTVSHFENFIQCVRSRRVEDLYCDILEGHLSATLCHIGNISFRLGRKLVFDPQTETFPGEAEANRLLTRTYRAPYSLPDRV
jgi:hypothetical protein